MSKRGRPKKVRYVQKMPRIVQFSPRGAPGRPLEVELSIDQFEAIKLTDLQGFDQVQAAMAMRISRPSFGRILGQARGKLADAIVNGKIIKIRMGDAQIGVTSRDFTIENFNQEIEMFNERSRKIMANIKNISKNCKIKDKVTDKENEKPELVSNP